MELEEILRLFYRASHIPVSLMEEGSLLLSIHGHSADHNLPLLVTAGLPETLPRSWYARLTDHTLFGGMEPARGGLLILGPVPAHDLSSGHVMEIMRQVGYRPADFEDISQYFSRQAICDEEMIGAALQMLSMLLGDAAFTGTVPCVSYRRPPLFPVLPEEPDENRDPSMERAILASIRSGNPEKLRKLLQAHQISRGGGRRPSITPIENSYLVGSITLASREAVKGGMDYSRSMNICSRYLDNLLAARSIREQTGIFLDAMLDYAGEVRKLRESLPGDAAEPARSVAGYVLGHLGGVNTPAAIAAALGYTPSYLCTAFRRQTGMTISEYVNRQRIEEAKRLLESSGASPGNIALQLGFASQSYFCTVFRQLTGMSPGAYRRSHLQ